MAYETSVAVVWMTPDSQLRMRDIEDICDSASPLNKETVSTRNQWKESLKVMINMLKCNNSKFCSLVGNTPLCKYFTFSLFILQLMGIQVVYINNAAMNKVEQMSLWYDCSSIGYMPKYSIPGSWHRLIPNFLQTTILISKVAKQPYPVPGTSFCLSQGLYCCEETW